MRDSQGLAAMTAMEAVASRRSVRRFLSTPIDEAVVRDILIRAARAASGTNIQPWMVHVVTGNSRDRLSRSALSTADAGEGCAEYRYLTDALEEPFRSRQRKVGFDLYALYGIDRHDLPARKAAMLRNYSFFGAPVGLFFTMKRDHALGAWLDCGMYMQNVMVLARAYGLATCPQQAWCDIGDVVHRELSIPDSQIILSGMALGVEDVSAPENTLVSERASLDEFMNWHA